MASVSKDSAAQGSSSKNGGKNKGTFLSRQAKATSSKVTESDLLSKQGDITPEDVLMLERATEGR